MEILSKANQLKQNLVQWKGLSVEDSSLEDFHQVKELYPELNHEDKVSLQGKGHDKNWIINLDPTIIEQQEEDIEPTTKPTAIPRTSRKSATDLALTVIPRISRKQRS